MFKNVKFFLGAIVLVTATVSPLANASADPLTCENVVERFKKFTELKRGLDRSLVDFLDANQRVTARLASEIRSMEGRRVLMPYGSSSGLAEISDYLGAFKLTTITAGWDSDQFMTDVGLLLPTCLK